MPEIFRNIVDNSHPVLLTATNPNGITILRLSLCNVTSTPIIVSLYKVASGNSNVPLYKFKNITLEASNTFIWEGTLLSGGSSLNLTLQGGQVDFNALYTDNLTPP